jgi:hypothetical protein
MVTVLLNTQGYEVPEYVLEIPWQRNSKPTALYIDYSQSRKQTSKSQGSPKWCKDKALYPKDGNVSADNKGRYGHREYAAWRTVLWRKWFRTAPYLVRDDVQFEGQEQKFRRHIQKDPQLRRTRIWDSQGSAD